MIAMLNDCKLLQNLKVDEKKIFNLLQKNGAMSKNEILLKAKMKLTTLNRIMNPLEKNGLIVEKCIGESTGGRKPVLYDVNICRFYILCIDISESCIDISIVNLRMEIIHKKVFQIEYGTSPNDLIEMIQKSIGSIYVELRLDFIQLAGLGLAVDTRVLPGVPIKEMLEKKLKCSIVSENRSNSAVVAEYLYGYGKMFSNLAYFNCGLCIREGTILQGRVLRTAGNNEYAFEQIISRSRDYINFKSMCIETKKYNLMPEKTIMNVARTLGTSMNSYVNLLNLNCIILDGCLASLDLFYNTCIKYVDGKVVFKRRGYFKDDVVPVGIAALVFERLVENQI